LRLTTHTYDANEFTRRVNISASAVWLCGRSQGDRVNRQIRRWQNSCVTRYVPSRDVILAGLSDIANQWRSIAVFWHAYVAVLLLSIVVRACRSARLLGYLLVLPIVSVSAAAWASHNPFNAAVFAGLSVALASIAYNLPEEAIRVASRRSVLLGSVFVAFGWVYPHFVDTSHWSEYLIAAPLGLLPCPTLATIIGVTLIVSGLSAAWSRTLATAGLLYAVIGVIRLTVSIDVVLLAGAATLMATVTRHAAKNFASLRTMN
jgi:hypothetical protein